MKNNFKKALSLILAIVITLSFTACGDTKNELKAGDYVISIDEFTYYYYLVWENYQSTAYQYDAAFGEGSGFKQLGYDYTLLPCEQEYKDVYSVLTEVKVEDLNVENPTWEDAFVRLAFDSILQVKYGIDQANKNGIVLETTQTEEANSMVSSIKKDAEGVNLSFEEYMMERYGCALNEEEFRKMYDESNLYNLTIESLEETCMNQVTEEEKQREYESDKANYDAYEGTIVADVRHILISFPEDVISGNKLELTDSEKEPYLKKAQDVLDLYKKNPTEDNFIQLVTEYSGDTASVADGGLFTSVKSDGEYVEEFEKWSVDPTRQVGDTGIIETGYGYHIMYFVKSHGDGKEYHITRAVAADKYYEAFTKAIKEQLSTIDLRSKKIKEITTEQNKLFKTLIDIQYRIEKE